MGFVVQPYLSRGSAEPCVARTMVQTGELLQPSTLDEAKRREVVEVAHQVMLKLCACLDDAEAITKQITQADAELASGQYRPQSGKASVMLPAVVDLRKHTESFLYNTKQALRTIAGIFSPFFGQSFDHRYQKMRAWAEKEFGEADPLVTLLRGDACWIERVIAMRNAVDHPASGDGTLTVLNYRLGPGQPPTVLAPAWYRDEEAPVPLLEDLASIQNDLLTFYEDLLCYAIEHGWGSGTPFLIYEVPETERDKACPVRLRVGLRSVPKHDA